MFSEFSHFLVSPLCFLLVHCSDWPMRTVLFCPFIHRCSLDSSWLHSRLSDLLDSFCHSANLLFSLFSLPILVGFMLAIEQNSSIYDILVDCRLRKVLVTIQSLLLYLLFPDNRPLFRPLLRNRATDFYCLLFSQQSLHFPLIVC